MIKQLPMFNKIYFAVLAIAVLVVGFLTFMSYSQLQSVGFAPTQIVENFLSYNNITQLSLWISSLTLLVLANVIIWTYRRSWALWTTFVFFALFLMLNYWWLGDLLVNYRMKNNIWDGGFYVGGIIAAVFCIVIAVGIFFNQFIVLRMRDKMFDQPTREIPSTVVEKTEEAKEEIENV